MTTLETRKSQAYRDDRAHVFHSWSAQGALDPLVVAGAEGSWFWDEDGHRYLDFSSQLVNANIGHQHPKMVEAIKAQAERLCTIAPFHANDQRSEAALHPGAARGVRELVDAGIGRRIAVLHAREVLGQGVLRFVALGALRASRSRRCAAATS